MRYNGRGNKSSAGFKEGHVNDLRMSSLHNAIEFATCEGFAGIVSHASPLLSQVVKYLLI